MKSRVPLTPTMKTPALLILFISACTTVTGQEVSPSPDSEFLVQPSNVTVPVGEQVILKCKTASKTQLCRWYFLELDLKFFDKRVTPMQVKEFSPPGRHDCSIKIAKVRKVQEGQWLCQALKFQSSKFIMSKPVVIRVITESESATWEPPKDDATDFTPRNGRREGETSSPSEVGFKFQSTDDAIIKDVFLHETAVLKCQVNQPIQTCSWITPSGENITATQGKYDSVYQFNILDGFRIIGNLSEGNCSIEISDVASNSEGNWHCIVHNLNTGHDIQGPLLHLHILDHDTASKHTHNEIPLANENQDQANFLVISLVTIAGILFMTVLLLLIFLYKRLKGSHDERQKILQTSPRNSLDLQTKTLSTNDLTSSSVIAVEPRKKLSAEDHHKGYYNQYLDMSGSGSNAGDGYIMMPGSSIRSSTSSRTTLSTLSTIPIGRSRSASNSTMDSGIFPHLSTIIDNPSYNPGAASNRRLPHRPNSIYSDHVYEEIKDKIDEIISKMENIPEVNSPTYTNTAEDSEGYLVPKISPSNTMLKQTGEENLPVETAETPVTNINTCTDVKSIQSANERPPYSVVGSSDLVLPISTYLDQLDLHPGYSKVGENIQNKSDPMEKYDIPRQIPALPTNNYDIPRPNPTPVNSPLNSTLKSTISENGLSGIIV